ncbi:hypothetical protein RN001_016033 [Aquatica leii]|uniref:Aurora kinase n=1 Tax=Aquatica leii TaxID=1421715 RepID=A0AAN7PMR3_9COLE|nr:hypothetical protein RN001_016033 [Aquatica leii]
MAYNNVEEEVEKCLNEVEIPEEDYEESKLFLTKMLSNEAYNNEEYNWSLSDFELGTRIGRGKFGRGFIEFYVMIGFLVGKPPVESKSDKETFVRILNADIRYPCHVPAGAIDLISKLLRRTSEERITLSDVMQHPWLINR